MGTRIYIQGQKDPLYTSRESIVSFVNYNHSPLSIGAINDSLLISLRPEHPAYVYQDLMAVIVSSGPLLTLPMPAVVWEAKQVAA